MSSNIFQVLGHEPEEEEHQQVKKTQFQPSNKKVDKGPTAHKEKAPAEHTSGKETYSRDQNKPKQKGVSSQPHPLDRQSGSNVTGVKSVNRKGGAGRRNEGTYKDELRAGEEEGQDQELTEEQRAEQEKQVLTLEDYYARQGKTITQDEKKINREDLFKGQQSRFKQPIDDKKDIFKKKQDLSSYNVSATSAQYADMLGFTTGLVEAKERRRRPQEEGGKPRRRDDQKEGEQQPQGEEQQQQEQQPEGQEKQEGTQEKHEEEREEGEEGERRRGNYRGGRGGRRGRGQRGGGRYGGDRRQDEDDNQGGRRYGGDRRQDEGDNQGSRRQEDRPQQGGRQGYGKKPEAPKIKPEDFPELG